MSDNEAMAAGRTTEERIRKMLETHFPIEVDGRVKWYPRHSLINKMRDDFEDRHVTTIREDDD